MISSILPALIVMQQEQERRREEEEWDEERSKREAIEFHIRNNKYSNLYSCSTPPNSGSCSNNGNSFENKPTENE